MYNFYLILFKIFKVNFKLILMNVVSMLSQYEILIKSYLIQYSSIRFNSIQFSSVRFGFILFDLVQFNCILFNSSIDLIQFS